MMNKDDVYSTPAWGLSDTNLIIPIENLPREESSNSQVVECLSEHNDISSSSMGPTLLIGIDKCFFEPNSTSKDVIFIQNADVKLTGELKIEGLQNEEANKSFISPGSYLISLIEPDKVNNWQNLNLRRVRKSRQELVQRGNRLGPSTSHLSFTAQTDGNKLKLPEFTEFCDEDSQRHLFSAEQEISISSTLDTGKEDVADRLCDVEKSLPSTLLQRKIKPLEVSGDIATVSEKVLSEQSLPLKKKAKMKGSGNASGATKIEETVTKETIPASKVEVSKVPIPTRKRARQTGKRQCCYSDAEISDEETSDMVPVENCGKPLEYGSMNDIVDDLKAKSLIDAAFGELILKGISEMKVDILQEMKDIWTAGSTSKHSYELQTFAFLLHFLRKPAYKYMRVVFQSAWPTTEQLREWKRLINSNTKNNKTKRKRNKPK